MKIRDLIAGQGRIISFEFFPPKSKEGEGQLFEAIGRLESFKPAFVSVTYGAGGGTRKTTGHVIERVSYGQVILLSLVQAILLPTHPLVNSR